MFIAPNDITAPASGFPVGEEKGEFKQALRIWQDLTEKDAGCTDEVSRVEQLLPLISRVDENIENKHWDEAEKALN
ncbi:MAG: hypothetical protein R6U35_02980, partial [Candidatus Humimicrobiaceae bacterium]